ncbi:MAG: peroxide stress protein YaaA [Peptococcaceae bacterium]|nr:peroxide stress protein YaaA [Peptococcaceae bacterium]
MKIIISPAKKMNSDSDLFAAESRPVFAGDAARLVAQLREMDAAALKALWQCSDKLAAENIARLAALDVERAQTPALFAYEGLQYQHIAPTVLSADALDYLRAHLRILSGLYGVLRPFDAVMPYRLEMQARLAVDGAQNLYDYWGARLYEALDEADGTIVNLASNEYARAITPHLAAGDRFVTLRFGEVIDGRFKQKATLAKMARGEMVRYMAENGVDDLAALADFDALGFRFAPDLSDAATMTFVKEDTDGH